MLRNPSFPAPSGRVRRARRSSRAGCSSGGDSPTDPGGAARSRRTTPTTWRSRPSIALGNPWGTMIEASSGLSAPGSLPASPRSAWPPSRLRAGRHPDVARHDVDRRRAHVRRSRAAASPCSAIRRTVPDATTDSVCVTSRVAGFGDATARFAATYRPGGLDRHRRPQPAARRALHRRSVGGHADLALHRAVSSGLERFFESRATTTLDDVALAQARGRADLPGDRQRARSRSRGRASPTARAARREVVERDDRDHVQRHALPGRDVNGSWHYSGTSRPARSCAPATSSSQTAAFRRRLAERASRPPGAAFAFGAAGGPLDCPIRALRLTSSSRPRAARVPPPAPYGPPQGVVMSVNKVILIGNLGAKPELRYTPGGQAVAQLHTRDQRALGRQGRPAAQERTEWHRIVVWGRTAENCGQYLDKGRSVYVEGRLQTREWQDKEGQKRYTTEIVAHDRAVPRRQGRRRRRRRGRRAATKTAWPAGVPVGRHGRRLRRRRRRRQRRRSAVLSAPPRARSIQADRGRLVSTGKLKRQEHAEVPAPR